MKNLAPGTYTIHENDSTNGTTLASGNDVKVIVENGKIDEASPVAYFTNNKVVDERTSIAITKQWVDADNQDGIRPTAAEFAAMVHLMNGEIEVTGVTPTVTDNGNGTYMVTYSNLPVKVNGDDTSYTIREDAITGYTTQNNAAANNGTIINTHVTETTKASVKKIWNDSDDQDGKRPSSLEVTLSNGAKVTLNEGNEWAATVENLPKYSHGQEIVYAWTEGTLPEGYSLTNTAKSGTVTTFTNSYTPGKTSYTVTKKWDDGSNQDGKRPSTVELTLAGTAMVNGVNEIVCTKSATFSGEGDNWQYTWTDLPKMHKSVQVVYAVNEAAVPNGYRSTVNGTTVTNTYAPEAVSISGVKTWDDSALINTSGYARPSSVRVTLTGKVGNEVVFQPETKTINGTADRWNYSWDNLPKYSNGKEITYTITEDVPSGYTASYDGYSVKNTANAESARVDGELKVIKTDQDGNALSGATFKLFSDAACENEVTSYVGGSFTIRTDDRALAGFLPSPGKSTTLYLQESAAPSGYERDVAVCPVTISAAVSVALNGGKFIATTAYSIASANKSELTVKNKRIETAPETTSATVKKIWSDDNNSADKRPASLKVSLSNGDEVTLSDANGWTATINNLPKYANDQEITYTWSEPEVNGYTQTGAVTDGTTTTITNTYTEQTPETTSATVQKVWNDADNSANKRPASLDVALSDGTKMVKTVTLNAGNSWSATIDNLPKTDFAGNVITYTWAESSLSSGYTLTSTKTVGTVTTLTNTYTAPAPTVEYTQVTGTKTWRDGGKSHDNARDVALVLTRTSSTGGSETVAATPTWNGDTYTFANLIQKDAAGITYTYSVAERPVAGYVTTQSGTNFTNTATTSATVKKTWDDAGNQDGARPAKLTVTLVNGLGVTAGTAELSALNG